jgi:polysaccharide biosynthesis protein PslJ
VAYRVIDAVGQNMGGARVSVAFRALALVVCALVAGVITGASVIRFGPTFTLVLVGLPALAGVYLRSVWVPFAAVIGVVCLLPFAVVPISTPAGTPAFIELAIFASLIVTVAVVLCDRRVRVPVGIVPSLWLSLAGFTVFAFILGLGRGYTPQTMHDFVKFFLALCSFVLVLLLVRKFADAVLVLRMLLAGTVVAAGLALVLYAGGPATTERALGRLVPYGYPDWRIVRYIEDDPGRPMRAVGTGVDPNSFGGLMMVGFLLGAGQVLSRQPVVSRWLSGSAASLCAIAMLLTYSRGAWVGAAAGLGLLLVMRRRTLLPVVVAGGVGLVALGIGSGFVERLWLGFTLQDPATRLRLQEYQNAFEIIRRHPWFGVGFGDAGAIDLQEGVSSTYLTVAQIAGLVGLMVFLAAIGGVLFVAVRRMSFYRISAGTDLLLTVSAAFTGILVVGMVDHYFFNIRFPHMTALFWILAGLIVTLTRMPEVESPVS